MAPAPAKPTGVRRVQAADVVLSQFIGLQGENRRAVFTQPTPVRAARQRCIQAWLMRQHQHAVASQRKIRFQRRNADRKRGLERRKCVLGGQAACAAMTLQINRVRERSDRRQ